MAGITDMKSSMPPSSYTSFPPPITTNPLRVRDASFSAPKKYAPLPAIEDDSEICIFDAHNYFNEHQKTVAAKSAATRASPVSSVEEGYGRNYRARQSHAAPKAPPEATWNSQTGLLCNSPRKIGVKMRTMGSHEKRSTVFSSWKWFFGMICRGKKAVEIKEKVALTLEPKRHLTVNPIHYKVSQKSAKSYINRQHGHGRGRDLADRPDLIRAPPNFPSTQISHTVLASGTGFSFPILSRPPPAKLVFNPVPVSLPLEEPPRVSLEIFRPSDDSITPPPKLGGAAMDDDGGGGMASDTSSDLFEIESFMTQTTTTTTNYHSFDDINRRFGYFRRSLDESDTPSVAATEFYEPSEASIEWSATTAEGFDRGSLTNFSASASDIVDVDDVTLMRLELQRLGNGGFEENGGGGGGKRRGNAMLMSCRCDVGRRGLRW